MILCDLLFAAIIGAPGPAQLRDLAAPGNGAEVYFATDRPLKGTDDPPQGRIYKYSSAGLELFAARKEEDPEPPNTIVPVFTNYYSLSRPEFSRDAAIKAFTGARRCSGADRCAILTTLETTVTGVPEKDEIHLTGAGRLSGNGRYLLLYDYGTVGSGICTVVDLVTDKSSAAGARSDCQTGAGRAVSDDGVAVFGSSDIYLHDAPNHLTVQLGFGEQPVIDSKGTVIVYAAHDSGMPRSRPIRVFHREQQQDDVIARGNGDSHAPMVSADGQRVAFLSTAKFGSEDPPGAYQLWTVNIDGTGLRQATNDPTGVVRAALSDDGLVVWYVSGSRRLLRVDLITGETGEALGRTPELSFASPFMTPGSTLSLTGGGFADRSWYPQSTPLPVELGNTTVTVDGVAAPLLSVTPDRIVFQVPWETPSGAPPPRVEIKVLADDTSSPFAGVFDFISESITARPTFVTGKSGLILAAHENWDKLVDADNPLRPGEIIHLYAIGLGPVRPQPATGMPSPGDPPARTIVPVTCTTLNAHNQVSNVEVLFAGLAPTFVGYYQMDLRAPVSDVFPDFRLTCAGGGDNTNFYGSLRAEALFIR